MNTHNILLNALNKVYGTEGANSTFKPIDKYYDRNTGELVTIIEFRSRKKGEVVVKSNRPTLAQQNRGLLQTILNQNKPEPKTRSKK